MLLFLLLFVNPPRGEVCVLDAVDVVRRPSGAFVDTYP
jgi:hypothetical protein